MKITDKKSLIDAAIVYSHRTDLAPYMDQFLGEAEDRISSSVRSIYNQNETTISYNSSSDSFPVPDDYLEPIYYFYNGVPIQVDTMRMKQYNQTDLPIGSYFNRAIHVMPTPETGDTMNIGYFSVPSILVNDTSTNDLLTYEPLIYLYPLMMSVTLFMEQIDMFQVWTDRFQGEVSRVNAISLESHPGGGPLAVKGIQ